MKHMVVLAALGALVLVSCMNGSSDVVVVSKVMKSDANASMTGGPDLGLNVPSSGSIYWIEGRLKNNGSTVVNKVRVSFRVTDGNTTIVLAAEIVSIPPGKTVDFRTPVQGSRMALRLIEEDPGISIGR